MSRLHWILLILVSAFASLTLGMDQGTTPKTDKDDTVSVKAFKLNKVIGHLGHPLGTIVRITGVAVNGSETGWKADDGQVLLRVQTVNGHRIEKAVDFYFRRGEFRFAPSAGQSFDYYAHEWGRFDGVVDLPKELHVNNLPVQNDGFHYRREITIHKSNL